MTEMNDHPQNLPDFIAGKLEKCKAELVLNHLAECESCLTEVDRLWEDVSLAVHHPDPSSHLTSEKLDQLEKNLLTAIHRADFGGQVVKFSVLGFLNVFMALLAPFLAGVRSYPKNKE